MRFSKALILIVLLNSAGLGVFGQGKSGTVPEIAVMTYNIRNGEAKDGTNSWEYRYPLSAMMIMEQKPDVIGIQEAYSYQKKYLNEFCAGYKGVGVGRENGKTKGLDAGEIMAIFYNTKTVSMVKWGTFWLSETPDEPSIGWDAACKRTATWALMKDKKTGRNFYFVNTHLDHVGQEAQKNGAALIVKKIDEINTDGLPVVLVGDFNVEPTNPALGPIEVAMNSARETAVETDMGATYNGWGKASEVIDHIYYSGFTGCVEFKGIRKEYGERKFISDHYPVKAILVF